jgi:BNR repeat-containing family member
MRCREFLVTAGIVGITISSMGLAADLPAPSSNVALSEHGCGRATGYAVTNKIVSLGERSHVAWLDSRDGQFLVRVRSLDRETDTWSPVRAIGNAHDNHGGPALAADSRGYLHIVYFPHHHPFRYRRSLRPNDSSEWTPEVSFGTRCTYPSMVVLPDDTLVLVCRERTDQRWLMKLYRKPAGREWEGPKTILHGNAPSGYTRWQGALALGEGGWTIHMSFMIYESSPGPGYAIGYFRSRDGGNNWERSDGTPVRLPATPATIEIVEGTRRLIGPANLRPGNIAIAPDGTPWMVYSRLDRQPFETWLARPADGGGWTNTSLLPAIQKRWPERSVKTPGQIAFDTDGRMYLALTTVHAATSVERAYWGHQSAEVVLLYSDDLGCTFHVVPISPPDDQVPNWLPSLERPTGQVLKGVPSLMYTHGHRGSNNRQIIENDVLWCDLTAAIGE